MGKTINNKLSSKETRIMFCTGRWLTGGMERKLSNLFKELKKHYKIYLLTVGDSDSVIRISKDIKNIVISDKDFIEKYSDVALLHAKENSIDIVVGVMNLFYGQLGFYEKCSQNNIKTIAANSEYYFYPYHNEYLYNIVSRRQEVFSFVDAVLWQTNFGAAVYGYINKNGYVMPNPNTFSKQTSLSKKDKKIILCVGRFNDYIKRIDRILSCYKKVLEKEPDAKLWLVGPCDRKLAIEKLGNKSIDEMIKEQKLDDSQIMFFGEAKSVDQYYSKASVLLLTSENEGFSNVINEAACFGLPIVCNDVPGLEDMITDGYNGFVSQQDDIESLANNICRILFDQKLRKKMGVNASKYVERFNGEVIALKWRKLIDAVTLSNNNSDLNNKIHQELGYRIDDYNVFCLRLIKELNNVFNEVNMQLCEKNRDLVSLNSEIEIMLKKYNEMEGKYNEMGNKYRAVEHRYNETINSRSWKLITRLRNITLKIKPKK